MDLFSTTSLNRVIDVVPIVEPLFWLNAFFTEEETSTNEDIKFDVKNKKRRMITPLVNPLIKGRIIRGQGYRTGSVAPAYLKDKRVFNPNNYFKRTVGEKLGGSLTPEQRLAAAVGFALTDQLEMWQRRLNAMAAEVVRTGKIVLESQDFERAEVDFRRDEDMTIVLTGNDKWDSDDSDPLGDIEEWGQRIFDRSGYVVSDVILAADVWKTLRVRMADKDTKFGRACLLQLDMNQAVLTQARMELGPMLIKTGMRLVALFGEYRLWVHSDKFEDEDAEGDLREVDLLPAGEVVMASRDGVQGVRHFGAIRDLKAGIQARQFFVKSWEEEEPSERFILGQSAPLLVPYGANASLGAKVK